ncbi:hypothetical protein CC80DRAFT_530628 [Byssothecium circinans]|uniref:Mid2 domain-containing protein n=1 Tax=Byssothecium circinans TaxID=147558 RepID=A0A6A5UNL7_9PLEO|nr:hypothetical protein CC80DRAFT_530628 [Byssothecium circinans]
MALHLRASTLPTTCYTPSGRKTDFDTLSYIPCNITAIENGKHSACRAVTDRCLPHKCAPGMGIGEWELGDGYWCCAKGNVTEYKSRGTVNTTCCDTDGLAFGGQDAVVYATAQVKLDLKTSLDATQIRTATATGSSATPSPFSTSVLSLGTSTAASVNPSSPTSPSTVAGTSSSNSNIARGVGFGIGIPAAVAILIALIFLLHRYRQRRKMQGHQEHSDPSQHNMPQTLAYNTSHTPPFSSHP